VNIKDRAPVWLPEPAERTRLRTLFGVTQAELAAELKVTRKTVWSWEYGISNPTGRKRAAYADILATWAGREARLNSTSETVRAEIRKAGDSIDVPPALAKIQNRIT
jgi:transcriptional regulator with XRE-family HTH domain